MFSQPSRTVWFLLGLFSSIAAAAFLRFHNLQIIGVSGHDTFQYFNFSERLLNGDPFLLFYRPVAYFFNAIGIHLFDYQDYSIKYVVSFFDCLNTGLIFSLGVWLSGSLIAGFGLGLTYAVWPLMVSESQHELTHIYSATFILLFSLFFVGFYQKWRSAGKMSNKTIAMLGLSLGLAANTHEDLSLLTLFVGTVLFVLTWLEKKTFDKQFLVLFLKRSSVSAVGFLAPFFLGLAIFGFSEVFGNVKKMHQIVNDGGTSWIFSLINLAESFPKEIFGYYLSLAFAAVMGAGLLQLRKKINLHPNLRVLLLLGMVPIFYLFAYSFFVGNVNIPRLFSPMLPIGLSVGFVGLFLVLNDLKPKTGFVFVGILIALNLFSFRKQYGRPPDVSPHRKIFNAAKDLVTNDRRLALPLSFEMRTPMWGGSQAYSVKGRMYFGENAVTLFNQGKEAFDRVMIDLKIGYIFIPDRLNPIRSKEAIQSMKVLYDMDVKSEIQKAEAFYMREAPEVPDSLDGFDLQAAMLERRWLINKMIAVGAQKIRTIEGLGAIYALPNPE